MKRLALTIAMVTLPVMAVAAPAAKLFEHGKFEEAYRKFQHSAEKQPDHWALQYNLGTAAYRAGKAEEAVKALEKALSAPDRGLQARAFYNLGNTHYRIGEIVEKQGPQQALPVYERALKDYENALAITPDDEDAQFNRDLVKKKIEELKKQQEEQQQQQQQPQDQNQQSKNEDQQPQPQPQDNEKKEDQQKHEEQQAQEQQHQQPQQQAQDNQQKEQQQMEKIRVEAMLDDLRDEERNWNFFPELQMENKDTRGVVKDW
jgi:Ca-activated chloride channel family protein